LLESAFPVKANIFVTENKYIFYEIQSKGTMHTTQSEENKQNCWLFLKVFLTTYNFWGYIKPGIKPHKHATQKYKIQCMEQKFQNVHFNNY
jgi:hypothetical protein